MPRSYDDWLADGPEVICCDCGCGLGYLHDDRGTVVDGDVLCGDCAETRRELADDAAWTASDEM